MTGLPAVLIFNTAMLVFRFVYQDHGKQEIRDIPALRFLNQTIDDSVEKGKRIFWALGHGGIIGIPAVSGFTGLNLIPKIIKRSAQSDLPPAVASGEAVLDLLAESAVQSGLHEIKDIDLAGPAEISLSGLTPYSYAAGALPLAQQESNGLTVLFGSFGSEIGLVSEAAIDGGSAVIAASENLVAQAVVTASASDLLVGEDLFAAGAFFQNGKMHIASLRAQDFLRVILIIVLILGAAAKLIGVI